MELRNRYALDGPEGLGDVELVALILGTGTGGRSPLALAAALLDRFGDLAGLAAAEAEALASERGIGAARAIRLLAALHAGRRSLRAAPTPQPVRTPKEAWAVLAPALAGLRDEELHALYLDRRRHPLARRALTRGTDAFTVVDPRQVFRAAVAMGASAVILAHNHPSGDPSPSPQDRDVTRRVASAGRVLGIQLVDHLVVAGERWVSLAELGELPAWRSEPASWVAGASPDSWPG